MNEQAITIYCFIDDFFKKIGRRTDAHCKINDAELLTTALLSARYFHGNLCSAMLYMKQHQGVNMIDKSGFIRRLHSLRAGLHELFHSLAFTLKELNTSCRYLIDSFPVAVCDNIRIANCKLLQGEAYRGKCVSKRRYFYGFRVQVITTEDGLPVEFFINAGSFVDITAFQSMNICLPEDSELYADAAYTDYELEDLYHNMENINLMVCRKSNATRKDEPWQRFLKDHYRKRIETTFSGLTNLFGKKIHAVTPQGFILKVELFIFAYTLEKVIC